MEKIMRIRFTIGKNLHLKNCTWNFLDSGQQTQTSAGVFASANTHARVSASANYMINIMATKSPFQFKGNENIIKIEVGHIIVQAMHFKKEKEIIAKVK